MRAWLLSLPLLIAVASTAGAATINVGNFVWRDTDADGRQDVGENGLAGVTVQLWNSSKNQLFDTATTNASGQYQLTAPGPGNYRVRVLLPPDAAAFSPKDQFGDDQVDSDINGSGSDYGFTDVYEFGPSLISIISIDAGIRFPTPINIGNFVWRDRDEDGVQDAGEPGLAGITVQLWNSTKTAMFDSTVTSSGGIYRLVAPDAGSYRVRVILPSSFARFAPKDAGSSDLADSDFETAGTHVGFTDVYTFGTSTISITSIDAGIVQPEPVDLGDFVWDDFDRDGVQDAGEPGVGGVIVQLWNDPRTQMIDGATTNAAGRYNLVAPEPGNYRVRVILPGAQYAFSAKDQGDDALDSDINTASPVGFTDTVTVSPLIFDNTIDAGLAGPRAFADGFE